MSFGIYATDVGFSPLAAIVMSLIVFAGSAQFAAISTFAAGGGAGAAVAAGMMMNSRFLAMGAALGPSLPGRALWRALQGQPVVDGSWVLARESDGSFDRMRLFGATVPQYLTWNAGTMLGALGGGIFGDPQALGLDAVYPAFFVSLLIVELRDGRTVAVALLGALTTLTLVPLAPPGLPVLAAGAVALVGLHRRAQTAALRRPEPEGEAAG